MPESSVFTAAADRLFPGFVCSESFLAQVFSDAEGWQGIGVFHRSPWDFCNNQFFFCQSHNAGRVFLFPVAWGQHAGGRMTVSTLVLILLLTFAVAGALERLKSILTK
jgi:hypothetical protein